MIGIGRKIERDRVPRVTLDRFPRQRRLLLILIGRGRFLLPV